MTIAKFYTPEEGGHWTPFPFEFEKSKLDGFFPITVGGITINTPTLFKQDGYDSFSAYSILFSDGSIYDIGSKCCFRSENDFPKDEIIEYMNGVLSNG